MLGRDVVIRNVTARPLGSLAPGYAATTRGYTAYAFLVFNIGFVLLAINLANTWLIIGSIGLFIVVSITTIAGEVVTFRNLKR